MSFDERSHKLITFEVGSFGNLGVEGSYFNDKLAASVVGGRDEGSMARKGVLTERFLQIVSVTTRMSAFRGGCPARSYSLEIARMQEGVRGEGMIDQNTWRGDGVWTRNINLEGLVIGYVIRRKGETRTASGVD